MELVIFFILAIICSGLGYFIFIKNSPKRKFNLRDKEDNRFFDFGDQF